MSKKGHHGGAWKVAYADFVTAMMALFMVLWLSSQDAKIKEAVARAFRNPFSSINKESTGIIPKQKQETDQIVTDKSGNFSSASAVELTMLRRINQDLEQSLEQVDDQNKDEDTKIEMTPQGLLINIFDRTHKAIFEPQSIKFTPYGEWVFSTLAWQISRYSGFAIELEGHTEFGNQPVNADYGDWELSTDRANAVRRKLLEHGVRSGQIRKVAGYGATAPMPNTDAADERNRRVSVLLNAKEGHL